MQLPAFLRALLGFGMIVLNTLWHATPLLLLAVVKLLLPVAAWRVALSRVLVRLAESWIAVNSRLITTWAGTAMHVDGMQGLRGDGWYLVLCNHQSWVDILVLQAIFNRRIPFLKFFLKRELIWVPVLGLAWWALDFPFMRRYSRELLQRKPHLRGKDVDATRRACAKFRDLPVSVMNFVEGTRFTTVKHAAQHSPYIHLLSPRVGGVAYVMNAMGELLQAVVDVTIVYPAGPPGVWSLLRGDVREVRIVVRQRPIPASLLGGDYEKDGVFRERFQAWIKELWAEKDRQFGSMSGRLSP